MPPESSSACKKGKTIAKKQAQQEEELQDLSRKVGLSSSDKDEASGVSVTLSDVSPLAGLQAKDGTTPTPLQQWLQDGDKRVQPEKVGLKSPQSKRGSHNKREMVQSPHHSSSAPYPPGTRVFAPKDVEVVEGSGQMTALTEAEYKDDISSPSS